ncbi:uncharacterized protein [Haliotis asinina]|uniref:uncharacterized protein n=1 Tax=Haliotis asinina TaxID=109174 RepID=UPI003531CE7F
MFSLEDVMKIAKMAGVAGPLEDVLKKTLSTETPVETTTTVTPTLAEVTRPSPASTRRRTRMRITSTEPYQSRRFRNNHDPRRAPNLPSTRETPTRVPKVMYKASERIRRRRPRRPVVTDSTTDNDPPRRNTELPSTTKIYSTETSTNHPITETTLAETILPTPENIVTEMTTLDKARREEKRLDNTFNSIQQFLTKNLNSLLSSSRAIRGQMSEQAVPWALSASDEADKSRDQFSVTESTTISSTISSGTTLPEASTTMDVEEAIATESAVKTSPPATIVSVKTTTNLVIDETTIKKIQEATGSPNLDDIFGSMRQDLTKADFLNLLTTNFNIPIEEAKKLLPVTTPEKSTSKYTTEEVATFVDTPKVSASTATVITTTPVTTSPNTTTSTIVSTTAASTLKPTTPHPVTSRKVTVTTATTSTTVQPTSTQTFKNTNDVNITSGSIPMESKKTPPPLLQRLSSLSKYSLKKLSLKSRPFKNPPSRDKLLRMLRDSNKKRVKLLSTYRKMGYHRVENYKKSTTTTVPITMGRTAKAITIVTATPSNKNMTSQVHTEPNAGVLQTSIPPAAPGAPFIKTSHIVDINTLKTKSADSLTVNDLLLLLQMKINKVKPTKVVLQEISTTTATPSLHVQQGLFLSNSTGERRNETPQKQNMISTSNEKTTTVTPVVKMKTHKIKSRIDVLNRDIFAKLKFMAQARKIEGKTTAPTSVTSKPTTFPTTTVPPTVPRVLSVLIRPQKRKMPKRTQQKKYLVTTTQTPTTQSVDIQVTTEEKIDNRLTVNNFMSSLRENIHGLNSSKNLDAFEKKLERILATSRRLRGRSHGTVHDGINVKSKSRKTLNNSQRMRKRNQISKIPFVPKPQSTTTTTQTPRQQPTTTYSQFSQDVGDYIQPRYQDIMAMGQTNITALIKSIIRTSQQQEPSYVPQTQPVPDPTVPPFIEPVPMLEPSTPETIHLSDIQISFKTNIPKSDRLEGGGGRGGVQRDATTNHVKDTYKPPVHVHGGIDVQIQEAGDTDVVSEPEPEPEAEPEPEPLVPRAGYHEKDILLHNRIQNHGGPSIGPNQDVIAEPETRPSARSADSIHTGQLQLVSDIYNAKTNTDMNRMITVHQYTQTENPPVQIPEQAVQGIHIQEVVSEPTAYSESAHGLTRTISLRSMQRNNRLQTRVVPANSSPGRSAKGRYRVSYGENEQGASARGPRVSSPRSMTSISSSRPGIPTMERRPRDLIAEETVATDDSTNINSKSNLTSFDTKRSHLSSSQLYPGAQYSRHPSQEPSSPYINIGRPSGIEHNFQTVGRTRASIRRREGRINNVPSHDHGNEPFPDVYGGMLMQRKHHAGVAIGSEGHHPSDVAQVNRHISPADQLTISQSNVHPVQNHASDVHHPDSHSRRQPVLLSANPRASQPQQYQAESLAPPDSNRRSMQSSNRRYTNGDFQRPRMQTVYDPESETYVTKPVMSNSQSRRSLHADTRYQRNQQHLHQQQQLHHQQQQQQYMRQHQILMQENYNQEQRTNTNALGHHAQIQRSQTRESNDPYYQNQQHLAPTQHYPQDGQYQGMTQGRNTGDVMMLMQII